MSAPECGVPTKKDGQPCRRHRYRSCDDHGSGEHPTLSRPTASEPIQPPDVPDPRRYFDRNWQRQTGKTFIGLLGSGHARRLRGMKDCEDLAKAARFLDQAARLEPGPLLQHVEALCGPDTADLVRTLTEKLLERLTGIDSLKNVAKMLRCAGIWHCAVAGTLATCPCLNYFQQEATMSLRDDILNNSNPLSIADGT
jgi:hypothetical protein